MFLCLIHGELGYLFQHFHLGFLDLVSLFKLFIGCFQLFLELIVLLFKGVILLVKVFFLLLDTAFLTGKLVPALLDLLFKLCAALVDLVLSLDQRYLLLAVSLFLCCFNDSFGLLFGRAYRCFCLGFAVLYAFTEKYKSRYGRRCHKYCNIDHVITSFIQTDYDNRFGGSWYLIDFRYPQFSFCYADIKNIKL